MEDSLNGHVDKSGMCERKSRAFGTDSNTWQACPPDVIISLTQAFSQGNELVVYTVRTQVFRGMSAGRQMYCQPHLADAVTLACKEERLAWNSVFLFFFFNPSSKTGCGLRFVTPALINPHFKSRRMPRRRNQTPHQMCGAHSEGKCTADHLLS